VLAAAAGVRASTHPSVKLRRQELALELGPAVTEIRVVGNETFTKDELLMYTQLQESGLFSVSHFTERILDRDLDNLERFYRSQGFFEAEVVAEDLGISDDGLEAQLLIGIYEGDRWTITDITFEGNAHLSDDDLRAATILEPGSPFVSEHVRDDQNALLQAYARKSYLDAKATQEIERDDENRTAAITYEIVEGEQARIREIKLHGNDKTRHYVVEREYQMTSGDLFDPEKIGESQAKIYETGLFTAVWMEPAREDSGKDLRRLNVRVRERPSGDVDIRLGYATIDGLLAGAEVTNRNVQGQSITLGAALYYSKISRSLRFSGADPWFMSWPIGILITAGYSWDDEVSYVGETTGGSVIFTKEYSKKLDFDVGYSYSRNVIFESSSSEIDVGTNTTASLLFAGNYDARDNILDAKRGNLARAQVDVASTALGGTNDFIRTNLNWRGYRDVRRGTIGALSARYGWITSWEESGFVPVNERFLAGGEGSVRGYPRNSLGPTDDEGKAVGGNAVIELRGEIRFRRVSNWQLVLFVDTGMVWHDVSAIDISELAVGAGVGVRYGTPIGSIRFDAAQPVNNEGDWQFYFGIGQAF
jgi:outer membrane protein assembly complex protein YaeT